MSGKLVGNNRCAVSSMILFNSSYKKSGIWYAQGDGAIKAPVPRMDPESTRLVSPDFQRVYETIRLWDNAEFSVDDARFSALAHPPPDPDTLQRNPAPQ
jgi:hypothetical protein